MTLSQRLTRAGAVFIVLGTVAVILPDQTESVMAAGTCNQNSYVLHLGSAGVIGTTDPGDTTSYAISTATPTKNQVFPAISPDGTKYYKASGVPNFTSYAETITITSTGSESITGFSPTQSGVTAVTASPGGSAVLQINNSTGGYAFAFDENQSSGSSSAGNFTDSITLSGGSGTGTPNGVTLMESASLTN